MPKIHPMIPEAPTRLVAAALFGAALAVALGVGPAPAQNVRVGLVGQPIFYSCVRDIPTPPSAPAGVKRHLDAKILSECGAGAEASGKIIVVDIFDDSGAVPTGQRGIQTVTVETTKYRMNPATGVCDRPQRTPMSITEYFENVAGQPARDHHVAAECCETRFVEQVTVRTIIAPLPAGAGPPFRDFGVGYPYTTPAERTAIEDKIANEGEVIWGYRYEYDGCNATPQTPSGKRHDMRYSLRRVDGPSGEIQITSEP